MATGKGASDGQVAGGRVAGLQWRSTESFLRAHRLNRGRGVGAAPGSGGGRARDNALPVWAWQQHSAAHSIWGRRGWAWQAVRTAWTEPRGPLRGHVGLCPWKHVELHRPFGMYASQRGPCSRPCPSCDLHLSRPG